jgi:hypothetical protein
MYFKDLATSTSTASLVPTKCRMSMDDQNPYAAPQADLEPTDYAIGGEGAIVRNGKKLLVPEGAPLPMRCVGCNRPASGAYSVRALRKQNQEVTLRVALGVAVASIGVFATTFYFIDTFPYLFLFLMLSIFVVALAVQQRNAMKLRFYICPGHNVARLMTNYVCILPYAILLSKDALGHWFGVDLDWGYVPVFPILFLLIGMLWLSNRVFNVPMLSAKCVNEVVECAGFGKQYLDSFPASDDLRVVGTSHNAYSTSTQTPYL